MAKVSSASRRRGDSVNTNLECLTNIIEDLNSDIALRTGIERLHSKYSRTVSIVIQRSTKKLATQIASHSLSYLSTSALY
jgi:hypothetical protein